MHDPSDPDEAGEADGNTRFLQRLATGRRGQGFASLGPTGGQVPGLAVREFVNPVVPPLSG